MHQVQGFPRLLRHARREHGQYAKLSLGIFTSNASMVMAECALERMPSHNEFWMVTHMYNIIFIIIFRQKRAIGFPRKNFVFISFEKTSNQVRPLVKQIFQDLGFGLNAKMPFEDYLKYIGNTKFVVSPPGMENLFYRFRSVMLLAAIRRPLTIAGTNN